MDKAEHSSKEDRGHTLRWRRGVTTMSGEGLESCWSHQVEVQDCFGRVQGRFGSGEPLLSNRSWKRLLPWKRSLLFT